MNGDFTGLEQRGLVGPGLRSARRETPNAVARSDARAPWGVWAAASPDRSTVSTITSPATRLSVSATGSTGIAAPWSAAARATAATSSGVATGRAPSWTRMTRSSPPVRRARRLPLRRIPGAGDAPFDHGDDRRRQPRRIAYSRRCDPREVTTTTRPTTPDDASASIDQASSGRPADVGQLVEAVHPPRCPGGHDDRVGERVGIRRARPA